MKKMEFYEPNESYGFLSNFYPSDILFDKKIWPSAEHLYQSFKFRDPLLREEISTISSASEVFTFSRTNQKFVRKDWEKFKLSSMYMTCVNKFFQNNRLRRSLLKTDGLLQEASPTDDFWGLGADGDGENYLGRILVQIRRRLSKLNNFYNDLATCFLPINNRIFLMIAFEIESRDHFLIFTGQDRHEFSLLCRIHSECATGDLLGSQKCDCGDQLSESLRKIVESRYGVLAYLRQEGRGIGLVKKMKAYELQWYGQNTVDANLNVGSQVDERSYDILLPFLALLRPMNLQIITNNPAKLDFFECNCKAEIERIPTVPHANQFNREYLNVKSRLMNHRFAEIVQAA